MAEPFPHVIGPDGLPRYLAALPPRDDFGGLPRFGAANTLIPRGQWHDIDLTPLTGDVWDQGQHGSCVGHGSAKAFEVAYRIAGGTIPPGGFSPTSLYALINGGRDAGAVVSDAMDALMTRGLGLMADYPESVIYDRQLTAATLARVNAARARFKVADAFHCETVDAIGSAIMLGFPVSFGIAIRSGFNQVGPDGIVPEGGMVIGGHCMLIVGMVTIGGKRYFIVMNSWGTRFGKAGFCLLSEWHFQRGGQLDAFAVRADMTDPQDPTPAPVAY